MNWFKSIWMRLRKSNQLPGNEVLVPIKPEVVETVEPKPKRKRSTKEVKVVVK